MASTYSTNLALELIGTGDQAGTWGTTTNTNLGTLIEQAISGYVTQAVTTGNTTTLTIPNGATGVGRNMYIELTGTGGTNTVLAVPANKKLYFIFNNSTGAVTVKVTGQTGVSVAAAEKKILVSDGTDIVEATSYITAIGSSLTLTTLNATSASITTLTGTTLGYTSANITTATGTTFSATTMGAQSTTTFLGTSANITTLSGTNFSATSLTLTNALAVASGGSGRASTTAYAVICGGTTSTGAEQSIASVGTTGQVLTSNGAGALPTFQTAVSGAQDYIVQSYGIV